MRTVLRRGWVPGPGGRQPRGPAAAPPLVVDLRSDTVTRPCAAMRRAMARAAVGDDDYGEDPAVNELQRRAAATLGTESALFVPTATMANLIAVMCHCQRRGAQLFLGRDAHLHVYEHGGAAQVAGVHSQALPDLPNGTFDLEQLEQAIREAHGSQYHPRPELICLENTHSSAGGRALPLTYLRQVRGLADHYGLRVHMDGARLMNAAVAQGVEPAQIAQHCDSVSLCFSKGLGAPAGAVLAGCRQFVAEAWRVRKLLGGGMRQVGVLAAAARLGLQHAEATLRRDHDNARRFAEGIHVLDSPLCSVNLAAVETNIVMVNIQGAWPSPTELCDRLRAVSEEEEAETGQAVSVLLFPWSARTVRAVWHRNISARDTELARRKLEFVARKCQEELALGLHPMPPGSGGA
ncbi:probable low-specificity L-threonine aldolase 2 [Onychostruthus taczanowskii]|uniref:probable low-specificity L-threonine aldolase 2 n=1 Tax=Onychostruthus taczanowskii TaxID=356909 RepID=UPI001B8013FD|nr:probable low-specificity L-threonine aldolase 2 [Onychostruthus taczanowskii]